jgi:hypothetical protein
VAEKLAGCGVPNQSLCRVPEGVFKNEKSPLMVHRQQDSLQTKIASKMPQAKIRPLVCEILSSTNSKIMKKIVLALTVVAVSAVSFQSQAAIKLLGFELSFEKGTKEWNADKTASECIGRGICKISVKANALTFNGNIGIDEEGHLILVPNADFNKRFSKELAEGNYPVSELKFQSGDLQSVGIQEALIVPSGKYPTKYDKATNSWYIILN